jgi:pimeloyl-ACP methyl ester carboxylesterase
MPHLTQDDATLWYDETGAGPPLVFVHGGWSNADAWAPQVESFATDFRVVTVDVRGHGRTGRTDRRRYSVDLFADDLEAVLDHLDVDQPILCGLSLGSMIVQTYLDRSPERAAAAVLAGPVRSVPSVEMPGWPTAATSPLPAVSASLSTVGSKSTFRSLLWATRLPTGDPWLAVDPAVRSEAIDAAGDVAPSEFEKIFSALYRFDPPSLSGHPTPTLVVYGDEESPVLKRQGDRIVSAVEAGEQAVVPDAGHLVNLDDPEAFNAACLRFLATAGAGG